MPEAGRAEVVDPAEAIRFVEAGGWLAASGGLVCEGWKAFPWSPSWFSGRYVATGRCLGVRARGAGASPASRRSRTTPGTRRRT